MPYKDKQASLVEVATLNSQSCFRLSKNVRYVFVESSEMQSTEIASSLDIFSSFWPIESSLSKVFRLSWNILWLLLTL